jgi:hypothetical protein
MNEKWMLVFIVFGALLFLGTWIQLEIRYRTHDRELLSKERLAAIEKGRGLPLNVPSTPQRKRSSFQDGIGFLVMGLGLACALALSGFKAWPWGIFVASIGIAHLLYWFLGGKEEWARQVALDEEAQRAYIRRLQADGSEVG